MTYSPDTIASIVNGRWIQKSRLPEIGPLAFDSRRIFFPASTAFFALVGERRNGHQFLQEVYQLGVRFFVVSEEVSPELFPEASILKVSDTLQALQALAAHHRRQFDLPVIGITGSNGKTIVKEWLFQLLQDQYRIVRSPRSYNSQIGVPLSLWAIDAEHELGIFEAGISKPGEMQQLEAMIKPDIGVFTQLGDAHDEGFSGLYEKFREKAILFREAATIIIPFAVLEKQGLPPAELFPAAHKIITWSDTHPQADLFAQDIVRTPGATRFQVKWQDRLFPVTLPFSDQASLENVLTCCCTLLALGMEMPAILPRLAMLTAVNMRLERKKGINQTILINDSYSADLHSLHIALEFLQQQKGSLPATVILSDLHQSGKTETDLYAAVAAELTKAGLARVIAIGPVISKHLHLPEAITLEKYNSVAEFIHAFRSARFREETILIKGARAFSFEQIVSLLESRTHETLLEIDLNALTQNLKSYQKALKPQVRTMAMVKAFAYGSGSAEIASVLQYHKVDYLGVAYADEGVELRKAGISLPVMVLNAEEYGFDSLVTHGLEPVIYAPEQLRSFDRFLREQGLTDYPIHIELETGMHRLGFTETELPVLLEYLQGDPVIRIRSVFSHLAASEDPAEDAFTRNQGARFLKMANQIREFAGYGILFHICNSAAILRHPDLQLDMVRLGIGLYGVAGNAEAGIDLVPVATLRTGIAHIQHLEPGETVSYNRKGKIEKPSRIATIRIGYADGYSRRFGNGVGKVWIRGKLAPTVGTVCMDMTMVDISDIPGVTEGDEVIIFGKQLPVQQIAQWAGTIPYEIMTGISGRVRRVYFQE